MRDRSVVRDVNELTLFWFAFWVRSVLTLRVCRDLYAMLSLIPSSANRSSEKACICCKVITSPLVHSYWLFALRYYSNDIRPLWTPLAFHNYHDSCIIGSCLFEYRVDSQPILIGLNPVYRYIVCYKFSLDWILSTGNVEHWKAKTFHPCDFKLVLLFLFKIC